MVGMSCSNMHQCTMSMQGGPGCSSQLGNLYTLGPYKVNNSLMLEPNPGLSCLYPALPFVMPANTTVTSTQLCTNSFTRPFLYQVSL